MSNRSAEPCSLLARHAKVHLDEQSEALLVLFSLFFLFIIAA